MRNNKENILKVLKAKEKFYWKMLKRSKENGNLEGYNYFSTLWAETETIILYFENPQFFTEMASLWISKGE